MMLPQHQLIQCNGVKKTIMINLSKSPEPQKHELHIRPNKTILNILGYRNNNKSKPKSEYVATKVPAAAPKRRRIKLKPL
jgi:hypothetical protein